MGALIVDEQCRRCLKYKFLCDMTAESAAHTLSYICGPCDREIAEQARGRTQRDIDERWAQITVCPACPPEEPSGWLRERATSAYGFEFCRTAGCYSKSIDPTSRSKQYCEHCQAVLDAKRDADRQTREMHAQSRREAREIRRAATPCSACGTPGVVPGGTRCSECKGLEAKYGTRYRQYGLTLHQYVDLVRTAVCHICGAPEGAAEKTFHIDHDHDTGAVRGLLCPSCNHGIGKFRDSPELLRNAIHYLTRGADYRSVGREDI